MEFLGAKGVASRDSGAPVHAGKFRLPLPGTGEVNEKVGRRERGDAAAGKDGGLQPPFRDHGKFSRAPALEILNDGQPPQPQRTRVPDRVPPKAPPPPPDAEVESTEVRDFSRTVAEIEWLLVILVLLFHVFQDSAEDPPLPSTAA